MLGTWETTDLWVRDEVVLIWLMDRFSGLVMKLEKTGEVPAGDHENSARHESLEARTGHIGRLRRTTTGCGELRFNSPLCGERHQPRIWRQLVLLDDR